MRQQAEQKAKLDFEEKVIQQVVDLAQVEFPPVLVEMEVDRMVNEQSRRLQMGGQGLEDYLKSVNQTEEELRDELKPLATKRITRSLVLGEVIEAEKIEVSDSEIDAEIEEVIKSSAKDKDEMQKLLKTPSSRESIKNLLVTRKTIQLLVEIAKGQATE